MSVIVFPGQGAQYPGMGKDFFEKFPASKEVFKTASDILAMDMAKVVFNSSEEDLKKTVITQPAMICTELAIFESVKEQLIIDATAGHSVGEVSALYASGAVTLEDAFRIITKRAALMDREAGKTQGVMYAMLALTDDDLNAALSDVKDGTVVAANYNTKGQVVVSGDQIGCDSLLSILEGKGLRFKAIKLKVSGAWHSPFMEGALKEYSEFIDGINISDANFPLIMNIFGRKVENADEIKHAVKKQIVSPVKWTDSMGIFQKYSDSLIEIGPGNVLTGLMKRFNRDMTLINIEKKEDIEKLGGRE